MYFKKLELQGFKSFAEPVTIEFDRGITCVVGPNGSGKSNISDAIRWVLGEQSPKMLRGAKMDEVIFAGTAGRKSRGMAEVTLTIDNSDGSLDIEFQEVALTRRMYRTGESEYFINRSQCRLRDIRELIMDTGIGVDGYSIIGQGKIADIISSKTESRREIFEEAAGIVAYRTRKAESERKLESTRGNMDRVLDIIGEIERKLPALEEDSIKAKEYLELRDRYRELEINIILRNIEKLELAAEYMKDDLLELGMQLDEVKESRQTAEETLAGCNRKNEELEKIAGETRQKLLAAVDELNTLVNKGDLDRERVSAIDRTLDQLKEEIRQAEEKLSREQENRQQLELADRDAGKELLTLRTELEERLSGYNEMSEELAELLAQADEQKNRVFEAASRISASEAEIGSLKLLRETLDRRQDALTSRLESGEDSNRDTIDQLNKLKSQHQQQEEEIEERKERQAALLKEIILRKADRTRLRKEAEKLRIETGELEARARTLRELEENYDGYNYAVKHEMRSRLGGICGVVAELLTVPEAYTTAIETALGGALQNIICEDDRSAKEAVRSLKENRAGRLTFLPVGSIRGGYRREEQALRQQGFLGFGPECVETEPRYEAIAEYLLGRVILVDDLDHAIAMSRQVQGYRFVTLEGEVISGGGAITGGRYKHRTANLLDRKAEITGLTRRIGEKEAGTRRTLEQLEAEEEKIRALEAASEELDQAIRRDTYEYIEKENEIRNFESSLRDLKSAAERTRGELHDIEEERARSRKLVEELEETIRSAGEARQEAETLGEARTAEYEALREKFDAVSEEITAARIRVNSCEKQREHMEEMRVSADRLLKETEEEIASRSERMRRLREEKTQITSGHEDVDGLIAEKERARQLLEEYMEEVTEEKTEVARAITEASAEKDDADRRLTELQDRKYELDVKQARTDTQLENYKEKLWDEFEISYAQAQDLRTEAFAMSSAVKETRGIRARMKELGEVHVGAIEEYAEEKKRYDFLTEQREDIQQAMDAIGSIIGELDQTIRRRFKDSFDRIVVNFEEKFRELFGGGHAELRLSDESHPLESEIDIIAQPPGKKLQNINLLSGGEKTLTAIALMFAVLAAKPTPFCILDEVEAALDDANIDRFIGCLRTLEGIQFTLVTHQKATMEHADVLYGVTMPEKGISQVLSLALGEDFPVEEGAAAGQ